MQRIKLHLSDRIVTHRLLVRKLHAREKSLMLDLMKRNNSDMLTSYYELPSSTVSDLGDKGINAFMNDIKCGSIAEYGVFRKGNNTELIGQILIMSDRLRSPRIAFYISKENRRKGYAVEAHDSFLRDIARKNHHLKNIWEEVVVGNNSARNLLIQNGFKITGIRKSSIFNLDDVSLCMRCSLKHHRPC